LLFHGLKGPVSSRPMHIQFLGAAGEVTGSRYLLQVQQNTKRRQLLVECGMFQGGRGVQEKNQAGFGFQPAALDAVVLTHAHIDHSGLLPRLCAQGYKNKIYCTTGTFELLKVLLMDSAHLQNASLLRAERRMAKGSWRGDLPTPLFTTDDVFQCLSQCQPTPYGKTFSPAPGVQCVFEDAGHILGSSIVVMDVEEQERDQEKRRKRVVFSGDLGMRGRPLMHDPTRIENADVLVMESTYGNRLHRSLKETEDELVTVIHQTITRGGNVIMPAFAVGRTQEVIYLLIDLIRQKRLPYLTIFVDSPMATTASEITERFMKSLDSATQDLYHWFQSHPEALRLRFLMSVEESKAVNQIKAGAVVISASGMCEAGRIVHHLYWNLPRPQSSVVITGFQAAGTRGRQLVDGAKSVTLLGEEVAVQASVHTLGGLSAHADQGDLLWWLEGFKTPPGKVFLVHGEETARENFATVIRDQLGWQHISLPKKDSLHPC